MKELDKKQKIIVMVIIAVIAGSILYYVYGKDETTYQTEILPYEENTLKEKEEIKEMEETEAEIIIYITGEVNQEGVYSLPEGARVADAIEQAGGLTENAYTEEINLAYVLEDGVKIKIPNKDDIYNKVETNTITEVENYITAESGMDIEERQTKTSEKVNINTATQEELETLVGIGPSIANKIVQYRKENGNFKTVDDIKNVSGIGESKFEKIKDYVCVK